MERKSELTVTLVGSFRYMDQFNLAKEKLERVGVRVLAPKGSSVAEMKSSFRVLDCDLPSQHPIDLEMGFLGSLLRSDFGYIIDPEGYMGVASVTETTIARCFGVPFIARELINQDLDQESVEWRRFCKTTEVCPLDELVDRIKNPRDTIHNLRFGNNRALLPEADLSRLALFILSTEWVKHRGLGFIVNEASRYYSGVQRAKIPVESSLPEFSSKANSPTSIFPYFR